MNQHRIAFGDISVDVPPTWREISDEVDCANPPFTLADDASDTGALQFSIAIYKSGPLPDPSPGQLLDMATELGASIGLSEAHERVKEFGNLRIGAISFRDGAGYFVRIWYVSNGKDIAKITYTCLWDLRFEQVDECEAIVRSIRFLE